MNYTKGDYTKCLEDICEIWYEDNLYCIVRTDDADKIIDMLNENEQLKKENQEYKSILQDMGLLMSDEDIINIRKDIADKLLKPLFASNGFDVDVDTSNGFAISLKEEKE